MPLPPPAKLEAAIVRVGEGRGFLVDLGTAVAIITAAHCLPRLPPPHGASYTEERTYEDLVSEIDEPPSVTVECLFVNPVADLAVLVEPDGQTRLNEWEAYDRFVDDRPTFKVAVADEQVRPGWLFSKRNNWEPCGVSSPRGRSVQVTDAATSATAPGTSGSPILNEDGNAVGVITLGPQPNVSLARELPAWLAKELIK
jgi:hypothetical protein